MKDEHFKDAAQDVAEDVVKDVASNVPGAAKDGGIKCLLNLAHHHFPAAEPTLNTRIPTRRMGRTLHRSEG